MATNGGTLHQGLPPTPRINLNCSQCGVLLDSVESLNVHNMHYHSEHINRWGAPPSGPNKSTSSTASNSPTDSENNNQPKHNIHNIQNSSKSGSPLNNTISAAADSSDNQPSTTQPSSTGGQEPRLAYGGYNMSNAPSPFQHQQAASEMHFQPYIHGYDQYYHHHTMEYGIPPAHFLNSQPPSQEYKPVPSNRFHPYFNHMANSAHSSAINSSVSPRNVSSSSPTQNSSVMQSTTSPSNSLIPTSQPTPSPSPNQCDKCGQICETACQLNDHYATAHGSTGHNESNRPVGSNEETEISSFPYNHYIKEEQPCDILDLDSHKMVYSPHDEPSQHGPLPSMHSLHPIQRPIMWPHDHHAFVPHHPQDLKPVLFPTNLPNKQDFSTTVIKQEYVHHQPQIGHQQQPDVKPFNNDVSANQVTTSPSEFPSTTTPQENGAQFRTSFEAATSSLPTSAPSGKSSSWKSNEARRPKTYNCTACNKWFTSSGHLKRHYNTTLHKNAVKSSGQPDPATVPISHHHHPARDQNKNSNNHRGSPGQGLAPPPPPEQSRSPEYSSQYLPPLGFQQTQGFQHCGTALAMHSTTGSSPNGQAGPSEHASQLRGLLNLSNNTGTHQVLPQQEQIFMQPTIQFHTINSQDQYNTINRIITSTNIITVSYQDIHQQPELLHPTYLTTGNDELDDIPEMLSANSIDYSSMLDIDTERSISSYNTLVPRTPAIGRLMGGVAAYQGDTAPPFSPDIPDSYQTMCQRNPMTPSSPATQPPSPIALGSPSITSTENGIHSIETESLIKCDKCVKVFNKACYLTQHNKTFHSGEKPFRCTKCGKRFHSGQSHQEHIAKHGAVKPFSCTNEHCSKSFNHKTDLRRHMCLHNGIKPYTCETCGKGFIRKDHMVKHTETHRRKSLKKRGISLIAIK